MPRVSTRAFSGLGFRAKELTTIRRLWSFFESVALELHSRLEPFICNREDSRSLIDFYQGELNAGGPLCWLDRASLAPRLACWLRSVDTITWHLGANRKYSGIYGGSCAMLAERVIPQELTMNSCTTGNTAVAYPSIPSSLPCVPDRYCRLQ